MTETKSPRNKLFLMMVLEFFIWGAWLPLIFGYLPSLGFTPVQQAWILNAFPFAAIVGMFFSNQFADRHFAAEKFLAFSHLVGGLAILGLGFTRQFWPFFVLMLVHCLLYVPTISIANSIAFAHMKDPQKEFGLVRMGGTIGWILAAWPFTFIFVDWARVKAAAPQGLGRLAGNGARLRAHRPGVEAGDALDLHRGGHRLPRAGGLQPASPAHAAEEEDGGDTPRNASPGWKRSSCSSIPFVLVLWLVTLVDAFVHNSTSTGPARSSARRRGRGRGHPRQLDHARHEHRPGRGDPHHARPGRDAEEPGLAARR